MTDTTKRAGASMKWALSRRKPYTNIGIRRLRCVRCEGQAVFQWNICSDHNNFRPICAPCDVALNRLVLDWIGHPNAAALIERYASEKLPLPGDRR
jgi:hypothetical protein